VSPHVTAVTSQDFAQIQCRGIFGIFDAKTGPFFAQKTAINESFFGSNEALI
jgi:hypothetical protein